MKNFSIKSLLTTMCLLFSAHVYAYDFEVDGMYYNVISFDEMTCAVTYGDKLYTGEIVIPKQVNYKNRTFSVTEIGKSAFKGCIDITGIIIPSYINAVRGCAFNGCVSLKKLKIEDCDKSLDLEFNGYYNESTNWGEQGGIFLDCPLEVVYIGRDLNDLYYTEYGYGKHFPPFMFQKNLVDVTISHSVTCIGDSQFLDCSALESLIIPNSVKEICDGAFNGCTGLKSLVIEDGDEILRLGAGSPSDSGRNGTGLFFRCPIETLYLGRNLDYESTQECGYSPFCRVETINNITFGNSVTEIGRTAFVRCTGLKNLTFDNSVTKIGVYAFFECTGLESITFDNSVTKIGPGAFYNCNGLKSITLGNSVIEIGTLAFYDCSSLTNFSLENSAVSEIDAEAFMRCSCLKSFTLGNTITEIKKGTFAGCSGLESLTLGNALKYIDDSAFNGCTSIKTIYSLNPIPPTYSAEFTNEQYLNANLYVPKGSLAVYQSTSPWKNFWSINEFDSTGIENVTVNDSCEDYIYDLQGNKLSTQKKGVNIINGKKIFIK